YFPDLYERRTFGATPGTVEHVYRVFAAGREVAQIHRTEQNGVVNPANDNVTYLHGDSQGSPTTLTNGSGTRVGAAQRFTPFGKSEPSQFGTIGVTSGFTGHEHDASLGLVNMRGRVYDNIV